MTKFDTLSSKEIERTMKSGRRYRGRSLLVFVAPVTEVLKIADPISLRKGKGKVAFISPKRLGGAVLRNRCRRVLRAGLTSALGFERSADYHILCEENNIILMAGALTLPLSSKQIAEEIAQIFDKAIEDDFSATKRCG